MSTLYEVYAINEKLFHLQSQSVLTEGSPTAQCYINHKKHGHQRAIFVREYKQEHGYTGALTFLGTCEYVRHPGEKPYSFIWNLEHEMPPALVPVTNKSII